MTFSKKYQALLIAFFSVILLDFLLANYDFAQTEKEKDSSTIKVDYLGSVSLESSLTKLVPEKDKQMIGLKEKWLNSKANLGADTMIAVSENGKYKVFGTDLDEKSEGVVQATFVDSNDAEIWNAVVGDFIYVSNNGRNIVAVNSFSQGIAFYDVRISTQPICTPDVHGIDVFSYNGEYFISAGRKLILRTADGNLIWEKDTRTDRLKAVAISEDGSHIVMASSGEPEPNISKVMGVKEKQESSHTAFPKPVEDEKRELYESAKKETMEIQETKLSQQTKLPKKEKKVYLSFLSKDGTAIKQIAIPLRIAQNLAMSLDGKYVALSCDSTLLLYHTETGALLWKKTYPTIYWWVKSMALSRDGNIIALGVRPNRGDLHSPPYLCLLSRDGSEITNFQLEESTSEKQALHYVWGPIVAFTEHERYILVATVTRKFLFKVIDVGR